METRPKWILIKDLRSTGYAKNNEGDERLRLDIQQAELWLAYLKKTKSRRKKRAP